MSTRVDVEEIQTTKGEKLLAVVLTIFLLIGGVWTYAKIDDAVRTTSPPDYSYRGTAPEQAAIARENQTQAWQKSFIETEEGQCSSIEMVVC